MPAHRLFFGLEVPGPVAEQLLQVPAPIAGAQWQAREQLHLTLAFLGEVGEPRLPLACTLARQLRHQRFDLRVQGLGCFGPADNPKILWAGVTPEDTLRQLQHHLATRLADHGFELERRAFKPHITLSRFHPPAGTVRPLLELYRNAVFGVMAVNHFALFESSAGTRGGSVYTVVERFELQHERSG